MAAEPQPSIRPLRSILREFIEHVVEGEDEIDRDELIAYALRRFDGDAEFAAAAARDVIPVAVPQLLTEIIRHRRTEMIATPRGAVSRRKVELTAREKLGRVFEATGMGYRSFLLLRKKDLLTLNARDEREVETRLVWVAFRSELASRMDDIRPVGDAFTSVELDGVWRKHFVEPKRKD